MSVSDDLRGLTALKTIQQDIIDPSSRSKVISIIQPYIESIYPESGELSKEILTQELSWVSMERSELFEKLANQSNDLDYSNIEFAAVVIKHTFLLANLSADGEVLDELEKLIQNFVASADKLQPSEEEIHQSVNNALEQLDSEQMEQISNEFIAIQRLFLFDKKKKTEFLDGLSRPQLHFALEVLFVGMVDFYCQQDGPAKGLAHTFTILNFADKEKGSNLWGYTYEQAYDRLQLIIDWAKKHQEIFDSMKLGAKILKELYSPDFKYPPLGMVYYLKLPENEQVYNFFRTLNFKS